VLTFQCVVCGKSHAAMLPEEAPETDPEKLAALKAAWGKADERAAQDGTPEERERRAANADKASLAYFTASRRTGVERVPDSIVTDRDGVFFLRCKEPCKPRRDGLRLGQPFFVIQLFDQEGYYSSVVDPSEAGARKKADRRCTAIKGGVVAFSLPFPGTWQGMTTNVSMPTDFREALAEVDRPPREG
jgi:hypothetical protein